MSLSVHFYHRFTKNPDRFADSSEEEIVEAVDAAFRRAVRLEFDKDLEYGYRHICDLSGGLDSRMTMWAAHELGYQDFLVLTYSKANYLDETVAKQIALHWKDEWFFRPLDDLKFFRDVDRLTEMTGGTSLYDGITGGQRFLDALNWDRFGVEHTGMIGDAVVGSILRSEEELETKRFSGMYSKRLRDRLHMGDFAEQFYDHEIYLAYTRMFHGACNTALIRGWYTEMGSPFMEPELFQLCMDIPLRLRCGHHIYRKWILEKYPVAARFKWESLNGYLTDSRARLFLRKTVERGPSAIRRILLRQPTSNGMNPLDYWFQTDRDTAAFVTGYFNRVEEEYGGLLSDTLRRDLRELFQNGNALEKSMCLSAYAAVKLVYHT